MNASTLTNHAVVSEEKSLSAPIDEMKTAAEQLYQEHKGEIEAAFHRIASSND